MMSEVLTERNKKTDELLVLWEQMLAENDAIITSLKVKR